MNYYDKLPLPVIIVSEEKGTEGEGQCDCACPSPSISQSYIKNALSEDALLMKNPLLRVIPIDANFSTLFIPSSNSISVVNNSTFELLESLKSPKTYSEATLCWQGVWGDELTQSINKLIDLGFLIEPGGELLTKPLENPEKLIIWLHVTNDCNLLCHYCYLQKTKESMDLNVGREAIDAIFRSAIIHNFQSVKIKYAGGEPSLNFSLIVSLHKYASQLAELYNLKLDGVILSNGVGLTSRMLESMLNHKLRLMISLDGIGESHDRQRMFINGAGSFDAVNRTVRRALLLGLIPDISITVTERNVDTLPTTIDWVLKHNLPFSINLYRENSISATFNDLQFSEEKIIQGMKSVFKVIERNLPSRSLLPSLIDRSNLAIPHTQTCGVGSNYMVIDHYGNISKCQMQITKPVTTVKSEDPLVFIRSDQIGIQNLNVDQKEECRNCEWRYWCAGGCPLSTHRTTGRYNVKSPNCSIYKNLYPEAVRLEGLRLLSLYAK